MKAKKIQIIVASTVLVLLVVGGYFFIQFRKGSTTTTSSDSVSNKVYNSLTITRADLDTELEDIQSVLMSAKASAYRLPDQESISGFQITDIQPNTFWTRFGFQEGDVITQVNGNNLDSASSAMNLYSSLTSATATKIEFSILRNSSAGLLIVNVQ